MTQYNTTLDTWYANCHWAIQKVLESPYNQVSEWLRWVTGDPNKVAGYAPTYAAIAQQVGQIAGEVEATATGIAGWEGPARQAFDAKMAELSRAFEQLAPAIAQTQEILHAAAETSVEAANMILDIIRGVIEFLVTSLAISAALSVFTFGASFGAWIAANLAKGAHALAQVASGLARVAQVLTRIGDLLVKIARIMEKIVEILKAIKTLLKALKELKKAVGLIGKGVIMGATALVRMPIKVAADGVLDGVTAVTGADINMPSGVGTTAGGAQHGWDAIEASRRAREAATGAP